MSGGAGDDVLVGGDGNDVINGDGVGTFTVALEIGASITGSTNPDDVSLMISGVPAGAILSAGQDRGDGSWFLSGSDLVGLQITAPDAAGFTLMVEAVATDGTNHRAQATLNVVPAGGNADVIYGLNGNDVLNGNEGNDFIDGGAGNDQINGGAGNDFVTGDAGNDSIDGGDGDDVVEGGNGHDVCQ